MIKQISKIYNFGVFKDFSWHDSIPTFSQYNLIYGWNYSGKTTLSRVFQAIELQKIQDDFSQGEFSVTLENGEIISDKDLSICPNVSVFNQKYIENNFKSECSANPLFIIGEESVILYDRIEQLNARINKIEKLKERFISNQKIKQKELDKLLTDTARNIRYVLGDPKFERPQLEKRIQEIKNDPGSFIKSEATIEADINTYKSGEQFDEQELIHTLDCDLEVLLNEANDLLSQTASQKAIERLKRNPQIETWVRQGLNLHDKLAICEFCGSTIGEERLEELQKHFSEEYENLLADIESKTQNIKGIKLEPAIPNKAALLPKFRGQYNQIKDQFLEWQHWSDRLLKQLAAELEKKKIAIERPMQFKPDTSPSSQEKQFIEELNQIIKNHNVIVKDIENQKQNLKQELEQHFAALFYTENSYELMKKKIEVFIESIARLEDLKIRIQEQIDEKKEIIEKSGTGAQELNKLLSYLLPGNNIEVVNVDDARFEFHRGDSLANCLSEGEKTAVTFAHFLISLDDSNTPITERIIFIDDPVSSLDSNHIYAVYAIIVERISDCLQLFISTHNNELFNLLKGHWLNERQNGSNTNKSRGYYIKRNVTLSGDLTAEIIDLPQLLRRFKSEYEFVFKQLYDYVANEDTQPNEMAYLVPNLLRKFLEAYLGFRKPNIRSWSRKLDLLFDNPENRREIQKFSDDASHLQSLNRSLCNPDYIYSSKKCVEMVLDALKEKDEDHYNSLLEIAIDS